MHLLHTASVYDGLYPPVGDIGPVHHPEQPVLHALLLQSPWRLGTARPNVQHGAGAPHGHFSPMRRSTRVLCAHGRLSAREELQDISRTPETQPTPHLLRIPPPYSRENNGKKKKNSEIRVTVFDADSGPAVAGASAHIPNTLTPIREHVHYHV